MDAVSLKTSARTTLGKKVRALRRNGVTPLHLYGPGGPPMALQAPSNLVRKTILNAGRTSPVTLSLESGSGEGESGDVLAFIRDVAVHPVTLEIQHVDFLRIHADHKIEVPVEIILVGDAPAMVGGAAQVNQIIRSLTVLAFPLNIPASVEADISGLEEIGDVLRVEDLKFPADVEPVAHPADAVARVQRQREAEVFTVVGEEAELAIEGEEVEADAEGAAPAAEAEGEVSGESE